MPPAQPHVGKWLVALTVMLPTFIEIMDTSVVNVSLPHIQGSLNAGLDEVTWVLTSYLVSNAIVIPISGWLSSVFGRKRYLIFSLLLFTASSLVCGAAGSLSLLVTARIFQGIGGGGLQPLSQAILLEAFPREEHGMAMAFFGMGVVMAPILGPVVGGWITDNWNWRWIFYINLPAGFLSLLMALAFIQDPPYIRRRNPGVDYWGLFFLSAGLGCLQIVLDKGERDDWFNSHFIVALSAVAVVALAAFVWVELRTANPVVNLRVFRDRAFASGSIIMFYGFFSLFAGLVLLPIYLQSLMGYTAFWAGVVLGPGGLASFFIMPVAGVLMRKGVSPRVLLTMGLSIMAYSLWLMSRFNLEASFAVVALPRVVMGFGLGLFFVPLATATFAGIPPQGMGNASGLFNLLRNLGGSFGVAFITTVLARRAQAHRGFLAEHVTPYNPGFQYSYEQIRQWLELHRPDLASGDGPLLFIAREAARQGGMMAFNDSFWLLCWIAASMLPLVFLLKRAGGGAAPGLAH